MASNSVLLVAAIDFGTTHSGWAFSFKHEYKADPTKTTTKHWFGGQIVSLKAPTTVLITPDGKTLDSFGYEAETKYANMACSDEYKAWYYFRHFKMMLHGKKTFDRNMKLEDETHKSLYAMTVFSMVIEFLKEDVLKTSRDRLTNSDLREDEIMWILTVPAIWDDAAKQFMREAAIKAGINEDNFRIALEPETASIFCCLLPVEKMVEVGGMSSFKTGSKYMVLDAGGGTVDITVHEVMPGGKLKEIHKASGGAWGGTQVDEAFKQFIISLVGSAVFCRFQTESKEDYLNLFRDFEIKKKDISPDSDNNVTFHFPYSLKEIFQEESGKDINNAIKQTRYADKVFMSGDKLRVSATVMKNLFSAAIQNTVSHVKELMKDSKVREISSILMVGGFSESKMLQDAIKSNFRNVTVIIPQEAGLVVLNGAVVFGHSPFSIAERVCKYTYGVNVSMPFDETIHDVCKRVEYDDGPRCKDIFSKHVEVGQTVAVNDTTEEYSYYSLSENQTNVEFGIYASTEKSPMYVTDEGCVNLGSVNVDILDMSVPRKQRTVLVSMSFGGTEIEETAKEQRTGKSARVTAGINEENFRIALEPETASIFCRLLPVEKMVEGGGMSSFKTGSKYMVLDSGGGTVDITVHEVMPGRKLKEIHKASGGAWGGTQVDEAFKQFIISLVGAPVFCRFQTESKEDYLNLVRDFEIKKKDISPDSDKTVTFHFPSSLKEIFQEESGEDISNAIKQTKYVDKVFMLGDKLRVSATVMKNLFSAAIQNTVSHVKELMKDSKVREISSILMVGGFSESKMLQDAIRSNFRNVTVIIPQEACLIVLNGAVVFGHSPFSIAERVCKYTYGVETTMEFDKTIHDVSKRVEYDDGPRCRDVFSKHVQVGQTVAVNDTTKDYSYYPLLENQTNIVFDIYASTEKSPMYVTDDGCVKLGSVTVDSLDMSVPRQQRIVLVSMRFGGTEIKVTAKEKRTGKTARATVNFLG